MGYGEIHVYDPTTKKVTLAGALDRHRQPGRRRRAGQERGGPARHRAGPELRSRTAGSTSTGCRTRRSTATRGWPSAASPASPSTSPTNKLDLGSEKVLLKWPVQIHSCCHAGGGMAFDSKGNLYIGTGDNNSVRLQRRLLRQQPEPNYKGVSFDDARRTAGNTNDLNGKILRIHPEPDGTYTLPTGNLFTGEETDEGGGKTRGEIYVMGVRNPARIFVDRQTDIALRRLGRPGRRRAVDDLGPGQVRHVRRHHRGGQPGLAVLHGQQAALPGPQSAGPDEAARLVRLRQPEERVAEQRRSGQPAAGHRQQHLVLAAGRRPGLPARRERHPHATSTEEAKLPAAVAEGRRPGHHERSGLPLRRGEHERRSRGPPTGTASGSSATSTTPTSRGTRWSSTRRTRAAAASRSTPSR